jgi:hypothetical protein
MGDVATADPGTCGTAEDAGALEQMWHLDLHHFCNEERGTKNLLKPSETCPVSAQRTSRKLGTLQDGARVSIVKPLSTNFDHVTHVNPQKSYGGVHVGIFPQLRIVATRPGERSVKVTPRNSPKMKAPEEIQLYNAIQCYTVSLYAIHHQGLQCSKSAARLNQESSGNTIYKTIQNLGQTLGLFMNSQRPQQKW